jgi:hypothetical protein
MLVSNVELVRAIRGSLPASMEWTERDLALLSLAQAQAADRDKFETVIAVEGGLPAFREAQSADHAGSTHRAGGCAG